MVTRKQLCSMQDHSLLGHVCDKNAVKKFADEVLKYGFRALALGPDNVAYASSYLEGRADVSAVVGFPQGANTTKVKIYEAVDALKNGATEIDMVINFSRFRNGEYDYVKNEIADVVKACKDVRPQVITKFIIYMPYDQDNPLRLTQEESGIVGDFIMEGGGDFIKYFGHHDYLVKRYAGRCALKWSGCPDLETMIRAAEQGVTRFGHERVPEWLEAAPDFI